MADVGTRRTWYLPLGRGRTDQRHQVDATFIGMGSSVQHQHRHHDPGASFARTDQRCGACRWFETRIFRVVTPPSDEPDHRARTEYVLHHVGASIVPGEVDLHRHELVYSAHEVIEAFTVRRVTDGHPSEPFMTRPAARALAMAAGYDRQLELAYVDRATA
jgi:hypothetical protein